MQEMDTFSAKFQSCVISVERFYNISVIHVTDSNLPCVNLV